MRLFSVPSKYCRSNPREIERKFLWFRRKRIVYAPHAIRINYLEWNGLWWDFSCSCIHCNVEFETQSDDYELIDNGVLKKIPPKNKPYFSDDIQPYLTDRWAKFVKGENADG